MRKSNILLGLLWASACNLPTVQTPEVQIAGSLRAVMHQGELGASIALDSLRKPGVYALGALDSLSGEILMLDGKLLISEVRGDSQLVTSPQHNGAALLVYSQVDDWKQIQLTSSDWETDIEKQARSSGLKEPFPFLLKGIFPRLDYHVINYDTQKGDLLHHRSGAFKSTLDQEPVTILGFYSRSHQGVFTHHDSYTHMHVQNADGTQMGHIDYLETGPEIFTLLLPK